MRRILFFGFICLVLWLSNALGGTSIVVKDIDGTVYKTVTIGTQVWMAENFRATRFNDGTPIPCISSDSSWASITRPARCWYKNDSTLNNTVGFLYNGFAATSEKLAPPGWKVPSYEDWQLLESYLKSKGYGCEDTTGRKSSGKYLASKSDWASTSNPGAVGNNSSLNNKSGFSAVPGGYRMDNTAQNPDYHFQSLSVTLNRNSNLRRQWITRISTPVPQPFLTIETVTTKESLKWTTLTKRC